MTRLRRAAAALAASSALLSASASASVVAERITEANAAERIFGGPDAIAGVGDWYLANDLVQIVVDDPSRRNGALNHGGSIVDAGVRGRRGDDQFARLWPLVNMDQRVLLNFDSIRAETDPGGRAASLVVWSTRGMGAVPRGGALARHFHPLVPEEHEIAGVFAETEYTVRAGEPFVRITTRLTNRGDDPAPVFAYGDVWMRGGRSMRAFVGNTLAPQRSRGFHHLSFDRNNILAASEAMAPYTFVAMAGLPAFPSVSYAIFSPERARQGRLFFGVTGKHVTLVNAFLRDPDWPEVTLWRLLRATRDELPAGASWSFERRLLVTDGPDVASATDVILPALGDLPVESGIRGRIEPQGLRASIHVETPEGVPVTQVAPRRSGAEAGRYQALLTPGDYVLVFRAEQRPLRRVPVSVEPGGLAEVPLQRYEAVGHLLFEPAFADAGPGRVIVSGMDGTADPVFEPELLDFRLDGERVASASETRELHFVGGDVDPRRVALAPGRYRLTASRGLEFELAEQVLEIPGPGAEVRVGPFAPTRAVALRDARSADLHVHAQASDDSGMANEARLRSYVAAFVDVMVSTDHDNLGYFEPALDALRVRDRIRVIQGVEITGSAPSAAAPWTVGHHNAWPVPYRPTAHRRGAPPSQGLGLADLYAQVRRDFGARVTQLNHGIEGSGGIVDSAYFTHLATAGAAYDPQLPIDAEPNRLLLARGSDGRTRAIDFDAMEVMNGGRVEQYLALREVWYSLLRQGFRRTATGNSDSHGPGSVAGYPRNYVLVGQAGFDAAGFDAALLEGRSFATTGPLITAFRANEGSMGDLVAAEDGRVRLTLAVSAPSWVPVEEVRLLLNGEVVRRWQDLAEPEKVMRLLRREELVLERDGFLTLEAGAPLDVDRDAWIRERGGVYSSLLAPGFVSQAISNPIFVDVDGDGLFAAPGLGGAPTAGGSRLLATGLVLLLLAWIWWRVRRRAIRGPRQRSSM